MNASRAADLLASEAQRLAALDSYQILDTPIEAAFEDITRIASLVCQTPIAVVNLVASGRQWFKSEIGLGVRETPLETSICAHAILQLGLLEVTDLSADSRFSGNPLVTADAGLRFYAGALLQSADGHPLGTVCVLDYKPRHLSADQRAVLLGLARQTMAQLELRRSLLRANQLQQVRARMVTTAGHDLKQPLQVISMNLDIARMKLKDSPLLKRLDLAQEATLQLGRRLDDLARLGSLGDGDMDQSSKHSFPINEVLVPLDRAWQYRAANRKIRLRVMPCAAVVISNPALLSSMLGNFIGNAIKYTVSGRILVGCRRRGSSLEVFVADTGIGIAPELQAEIFKPFRKIEVNSEGLGLGLALVRDSADQLGHPLKLRSAPGQGSCFSITLPRQKAAV